jgi:hypothetical protein
MPLPYRGGFFSPIKDSGYLQADPPAAHPAMRDGYASAIAPNPTLSVKQRLRPSASPPREGFSISPIPCLYAPRPTFGAPWVSVGDFSNRSPSASLRSALSAAAGYARRLLLSPIPLRGLGTLRRF